MKYDGAPTPTPDWLFVWFTAKLTDPAYRPSADFPRSDGVGYTRRSVPSYQDVIELYVEDTTVHRYNTYHAIMMGDVDGSYIDNTDTTYRALSINLDSAIIEDNYIEIPVMVSSSKAIQSIDFNMSFDTGIATHQSPFLKKTVFGVFLSLGYLW